MATTNRLNIPDLLGFYEDHLTRSVLPFWERHAIDGEYGGIFNFLDNDGTLNSTDKVLWSQGRALWTFSALYNCLDRNPKWLDFARSTAEFILGLSDGSSEWPFRVARDGAVIDGPQSVYVDAFMIYGLTEYARATGDERAIAAARKAFERSSPLLDDHSKLSTRPHAIPAGFQSHGPSMIFALTYHELGVLTGDTAILDRALQLAEIVMTQHLKPERRLLFELVRPGGGIDEGNDAGCTIIPGHAIESMWFMERIYSHHGASDRVRQAIGAIEWHMEHGWDEAYGGLFLATHTRGGQPVWHNPQAKVWWPATEALFALIRAYELTRASWTVKWYERMHEYAFRAFPNRQHGDWFQNLSRAGEPIPVVVAGLAVKDPFHLPRSLLYSILALRRMTNENPEPRRTSGCEVTEGL